MSSSSEGWATVAPMSLSGGGRRDLLSPEGGSRDLVSDGKGLLYVMKRRGNINAWDESRGEWLPLPSIGANKPEERGAIVRGKLYVAGMFTANSDGQRFVSFKVYNPSSRTWSDLPPMKTALNILEGMVSVRDELFVFGRILNIGHVDLDNSRAHMEVFNPEDQSWSNNQWPLDPQRFWYVIAAGGEGVFLVGGCHGWHDGRATNVEMYDARNECQSSTITPMSCSRKHCAAVGWDDCLYVFGGQNYEGNLRSAEVLNTSTWTWSALPDMPTRGGPCTAALVNDRIVVLDADGTCLEYRSPYHLPISKNTANHLPRYHKEKLLLILLLARRTPVVADLWWDILGFLNGPDFSARGSDQRQSRRSRSRNNGGSGGGSSQHDSSSRKRRCHGGGGDLV